MGKRTTPERQSTAFATIDLDATGRHVGHVMVPHSPDDDAWGVTPVPITIIGNGDGPTVILEGGNHGDEYEGPIVIGELVRGADPADINGRLILMPANNIHAMKVGRRTSPVDGLNFNRTFPGDPLGTITQQIAAFLTDEIMPRADAFLDLHSGGSSLDIIPSAIIEPTDDPDLHKRNVAAALAFDAPMTVVIGNLGEPRTATATACRSGLITVGTEMAGGGTVTPGSLDICRRGVANVLAHLGVMAGSSEPPTQRDRTVLELPGSRAFVYAGIDGVFAAAHVLGDEVRQGDIAGEIHCPWDPARTPETVRYHADGILYGVRQPSRVRPGNCCAVVAARYEGGLA